MTIKQIVDLVMTTHEIIDIKIEMRGGNLGRYHTYSKKNIYQFISGWENKEVLETIYNNKEVTDLPRLFILYK